MSVRDGVTVAVREGVLVGVKVDVKEGVIEGVNVKVEVGEKVAVGVRVAVAVGSGLAANGVRPPKPSSMPGTAPASSRSSS